MFLVLVTAVGCSSNTDKPVPTSPADATTSSESTPGPTASASTLAGDWQVVTKPGKVLEAKITHLDGNRYQLDVPGNFRGIYELTGDRLAMAECKDERMLAMVWKLDGMDSMVAVEAPAQRDIGSDYTGTVIRRASSESTAGEDK